MPTARPLRRLALALAALALAAGPARAQSRSAAVTIAAFLDAPISASAIRDIAFGTLVPGTSLTVLPQATNGCLGCASGQWQITRIASGNQANRAFMQLTFTTLPTTLVHSSGLATLPITWANAARSCLARTTTGVEYYCHTAWTPSQGVMHSVRINPDPAGQNGQRDLNIYLGGTVAPPAGQRAGVYNGVVTLLMTYGSF